MLIAARGLPVEKRSLFLQRVASDLELRRQSQKIDVDRAISVALRGLVQQAQKQTGGCHILPDEFQTVVADGTYGVRSVPPMDRDRTGSGRACLSHMPSKSAGKRRWR